MTTANANLKAPRVIGGRTATVIFIEINEKPQKSTQAITAAKALFFFVIIHPIKYT
jgi:hypothetical protein